MLTKMFEIRDRATMIPALAIKMLGTDPCETTFLRRSGYAADGGTIVLLRLNDQRASADPYGWGGCRTMTAAHLMIESNFDHLQPGSVIDARVYLGETEVPARAEIFA